MNLFALQTLATFNSAIFETLFCEMLHRLVSKADSQDQLLDSLTGTQANLGPLYLTAGYRQRQGEQQSCLPKRLLGEKYSSGKAWCHSSNDSVTEGAADGVVGVALLVTDVQGTILFGNPEVEELLQTRLNHLLGRSLAEIELEASTTPISQNILKVLKLLKQDVEEQTIALGPRLMANLRIFPLKDETGELFAWVKQITLQHSPLSVSDSTVLEEVNNNLTHPSKHGDHAFLIVHREGWIHSWHPQVRSLFPSLADIDQPMARQINAVDLLEAKIPQFLDFFQGALQGKFLEMEGWIADPSMNQSQKNVPCQLSYSPIWDGEGIPLGVCIVFRRHESFRVEPLRVGTAHSPRRTRCQEEQPTLSPSLNPPASPSSWLQAINRHLMEGDSLKTIAPVVLEHLRQGFQSDRVLLYQFQDDGSATAVFESVADPTLSLQGQNIQGAHFLRHHQGLNQPQICVMGDQQQVGGVSNPSPSPFALLSHSFKDATPTGTLPECSLLPQLQIKSYVAIPLILRRTPTPSGNWEIGRGKWSLPWGLLVMHQCEEPRQWQTEEIDLLCAIASQFSFALQQLQLSQQLADLHDQLEAKVLEKTGELQNQVQELQQLNHLKDDFLSMVAHELRAPLANMNMAIKMLSLTIPNYSLETQHSEGTDAKVSRSSSSPTYQRHHTYLDILQTECKRETDLINDLLDLQKLEANSFPIHPEMVNLNEWLPSVIEPFRSRIQQRNQILKVEIPEHLSPIFTDTSCLGRVLAELLNNACKYTPRQEEIIFQVQETSLNTAQATLRERTTGNIRFILCNRANIPPEELPRIFDKFYRVPHADIDKQGGTGLGLALVRQLVEQLEATLQVDSQAGWTTFTIDIPCHPSAPQLNNDYERLAG